MADLDREIWFFTELFFHLHLVWKEKIVRITVLLVLIYNKEAYF